MQDVYGRKFASVHERLWLPSVLSLRSFSSMINEEAVVFGDTYHNIWQGKVIPTAFVEAF